MVSRWRLPYPEMTPKMLSLKIKALEDEIAYLREKAQEEAEPLLVRASSLRREAKGEAIERIAALYLSAELSPNYFDVHEAVKKAYLRLYDSKREWLYGKAK